MFLFITVVFCATFFTAVDVTSAQTDPAESPVVEGIEVIEEPLGLPATDIRIIIARVIRIVLGLLGIILIVIILYGGYLWMTAGGNDEQIAQAKSILVNAVIGLIIILSAYSIVLFVMRLLGITGGGGGGGVGPPGQQNFQGSGALGAIVKDHYPERNQIGVPRNTKIIITFRRPIKPDSVIVNTNRDQDGSNAIFGDCINVGATMDWKTDCDTLREGADLITITRVDTGARVTGSALASYDSRGKVYTVVIRPHTYLGSDQQNIPYDVRIGKDVRLDDPVNRDPSIFDRRVVGNDYYAWRFTCSTELDNTAPIVNSVWPKAGSSKEKNTIIQIDFSEPMDPLGIQGSLATNTNGYFEVAGNNIFIKSSNSKLPEGAFTLTNGYRTLEFTPAAECGQNACGGKIYCMSVCDKPGATCTQDLYQVLLKAAKTFSASSPEAIQFSGVMDVASNALDGNKNRKVDFVSSTFTPEFPYPSTPLHDNYYWSFTLTDDIDDVAPYMQKVSPGLNAEFVEPDSEWSAVFSKRMRVEPMYDGIQIEQKPPQSVPLWRVPRATFNADDTTLTRMEHGPFLDAKRTYYFPFITSAVEDTSFNCLYPGKGPKGLDINTGKSLTCNEQNPTNCCGVTSTPQNQAFCCNGEVDSQGGSTLNTCLQKMRTSSP